MSEPSPPATTDWGLVAISGLAMSSVVLLFVLAIKHGGRAATTNPIEGALVRVDRLYGWRPKLEETIQDIREGRLSQSSHEPLRVSRLDTPRGGYFILDGHHRAIEAALANRTHVRAVLDPEMPRIERTGGAHRSIVEAKVSVVEFLRNA